MQIETLGIENPGLRVGIPTEPTTSPIEIHWRRSFRGRISFRYKFFLRVLLIPFKYIWGSLYSLPAPPAFGN